MATQYTRLDESTEVATEIAASAAAASLRTASELGIAYRSTVLGMVMVSAQMTADEVGGPAAAQTLRVIADTLERGEPILQRMPEHQGKTN